MIHKNQPNMTDIDRKVTIDIELKNMINIVTGGLNRTRAFIEKKVLIDGDIEIANELQEVFDKFGANERIRNTVLQNSKL